jgi:ribosomal protein L28
MEKECTICGKSSSMGRQYKKLISRYNPSPKKRKYPNLQWVTVPVETVKKKYKEFAGKRILACAKCIKALGKK